VWGDCTRHERGKEINFCKLNRSNLYRRFADTADEINALLWMISKKRPEWPMDRTWGVEISMQVVLDTEDRLKRERGTKLPLSLQHFLE
jgi:hypothetical protein